MQQPAKRVEHIPASALDEIAVKLTERARRIRQFSIASIFHAGSGHPGGALSAVDMLTCLYGAELNLGRDSFKPGALDNWRDRFILSKGHAVPALYATAAAQGLLDPSLLKDLRQFGSPLQGHPSVEDTPFVETSTGSLGQGFSVGVGIALGLRHQKIPARTYVMIGDGEMQEGEVWEAAMYAAHECLDNLCVLIDYNKLQSDDTNANICNLEPLADKWRAFGWNLIEIDGHEILSILDALALAGHHKDRPSAILAHTVKGRGVSYMENGPAWHGSVKLSVDDTRRALTELGLSSDETDRWIHGEIR